MTTLVTIALAYLQIGSLIWLFFLYANIVAWFRDAWLASIGYPPGEVQPLWLGAVSIIVWPWVTWAILRAAWRGAR